MTSLFKPKAAKIPTPVEAPFETQTDAINGVTVRRVKQPDGTYSTVTEELPRDAEEQRYIDALTQFRQSAAERIDALANNFDVSQIPGLGEYIDSYRAQMNTALDSNANRQAVTDERALARFGAEDSTAAVNQRALRNSAILSQRGVIENNAQQLGQQARQQELANQGSLYQLASQGLAADRSQLTAAAQGLVAQGLTQQAAKQGFNNTAATVAGQNAQLQAQASQAGLSNLVGLGALAAAPFTGGASLALMGAGSNFSSALGSQGAAKSTFKNGTTVSW